MGGGGEGGRGRNYDSYLSPTPHSRRPTPHSRRPTPVTPHPSPLSPTAWELQKQPVSERLLLVG
ncbi:MAG: hypothetical protein ACHBN1_04670 [Heteroscytonema crispum UTEX LB 1556]